MKIVAALLLLIAAVLSVTACEPAEGGGSTDTGPNGVIFMPIPTGNGSTLMPIFY
ncbi:hypothetical protein KIP29_gp61 [Mycobacterium phage BabyRay]|uniref:Lipoprotein n=1 Tax=Mycobacterium phage BabyRay TaxID=1897486 RepID=A0A1D8EW76_9CAUD|nr:hypothetical protein KIP29_gp61 [Mycobacterium phage BabyRay]AOT25482.1 hypothetical protein SEA_BABYRAY_39 [Mycobacterium phage BabyRay]